MRIAVVCGHFLPELGYIEVHLVRSFVQAGHAVGVFTSTVMPSYIGKATHEHFSATTEQTDGYQITRIRPYFNLGQMVRAKGLVEKVIKFQPELVVIIGIGKLFPTPLLKKKHLKHKTIVVLGDNSDNKKIYGDSSKRRLLGFLNKMKTSAIQKLLKNKAYRLTVQNADQLFAYTPETPEVVSGFIPNKMHALLRKKIKFISLGFDDRLYYFDEREREKKRKELQLSQDELVLVTATRVTANKRLERVISCMKSVKGFKYILIGFMQNDYEVALKKLIRDYGLRERILCYPFLPHEEVRKLYNAADIGIWHHPTISTIEGMGTGLTVLLEKRKKASHLLPDDKYGRFFIEDELSKILKDVCDNFRNSPNQRKDIAYGNKVKLSWHAISKQILDERVNFSHP